MRKALILGIIILVIIAGVVFRFIIKERKPITKAIASTIKPVEVTRVKRGEIRAELHLSGTIEPDSQVMVFPKVTGRIIEMHIDEGNRVAKGETLAVVEHEELELQAHQAEAAHQAAQAAYEQSEKLAKIKVESQVAQARARLSAAETSLQQVLAFAKTRTISQIEQAEAGLAALQANLEMIQSGAREEARKQTQAAVNQAQASLANAESNYKRMSKLFDSGAISAQSLESSQTQMEIAKAQYDTAVEQMRIIETGAREEEIRAMTARVKQAEAGLKLARVGGETKTWEKDIALAESQVDTARAVLKTAAALEAAKSWEAEIIAAATVVKQTKAALALATKRVEDATITAPIAGIVSQRYLDLGGMASPTAPLFEIVDMDKVKATVSVIEAELRQLDTGKQAWVSVDALTEPVVGKISLISPTLERKSRSAKVEITIDNSEMKLKPGMFTQVRIPVEIHANALLIPRSAVLEDSVKNIPLVFVVEDATSKRREVELGLSQGNTVEIISGLEVGEPVVTVGQHSLKVDEEVQVVNGLTIDN